MNLQFFDEFGSGFFDNFLFVVKVSFSGCCEYFVPQDCTKARALVSTVLVDDKIDQFITLSNTW